MLVHRQAISVNVPHKVFLPWFAERSPVGLFNASGPIPGVAAVVDQSGPWTSAGQQRRLTLTDGSTIVEEVIEYEPPHLFRYRMTGFTGVMARLVSEIRGVWRVSVSKAALSDCCRRRRNLRVELARCGQAAGDINR